MCYNIWGSWQVIELLYLFLVGPPLWLYLLTDTDLVDWRQRQEEVEKYCKTQRANSSQHQQFPMGIF